MTLPSKMESYFNSSYQVLDASCSFVAENIVSTFMRNSKYTYKICCKQTVWHSLVHFLVTR